MFLTFFPLIPLTLAGAVLFRKKTLAYGFPLLMVATKALFTDISVIHFFTLIPLFLAVYGIRKANPDGQTSMIRLAGYAFGAILTYEVISTSGVWLMGNCLAGYSSLYAHTLSDFLRCFGDSLPFTAIHLLRDIPLGVLMIKGAFAVKRIFAEKTAAAVSLKEAK